MPGGAANHDDVQIFGTGCVSQNLCSLVAIDVSCPSRRNSCKGLEMNTDDGWEVHGKQRATLSAARGRPRTQWQQITPTTYLLLSHISWCDAKCAATSSGTASTCCSSLRISSICSSSFSGLLLAGTAALLLACTSIYSLRCCFCWWLLCWFIGLL